MKNFAYVDAVERQWHSLMDAIKAPESRRMLYLASVLSLYSRGRHYHNLRHLDDLLQQADKLEFENPAAVRLAIFYHDIVYGRTSRAMLEIPEDSGLSNEAHSAALADEHMKKMGCDQALRRRVVSFIRMTETHQADPADRDAALFLDMDMSILGASPARYARYAAQIRAEHADVPQDQFCAGRKKFLERTLGTRFFMTDLYEKKLGAQARRNMERELAHIVSTGTPFGLPDKTPRPPRLQAPAP